MAEAKVSPIRGENRTTTSPTPLGPLTIKRMPAGQWSCDTCHTQGSGWAQIEQHFGRTEHRVYSEIKGPQA